MGWAAFGNRPPSLVVKFSLEDFFGEGKLFLPYSQPRSGAYTSESLTCKRKKINKYAC